MTLIKHAEVRSKQRSIPIELIKLIQAFGRTERRRGNAYAIYLDKKGEKQLEKVMRKGIQLYDKAKGIVVIISEEDDVITCYRQS